MKSIPFSFRQIDYLLAVAETGSTAAAARWLNVSQPSISLAVARFEAHFSAPLFLRLPGQGMQPTPQGRVHLDALQALMARGRAVFEGSDGLPAMVLGVYSTLGPLYAPRLIRAFGAQYPGVKITLVEADLPGLVSGLMTGRIDLAMVYDTGLPAELFLTPLRDIRPHALVPTDHPLARQRSVDLARLTNDPLVLIDLPHSRSYILSLFHLQGLQPRIGAETGSVEMLRAMVANGMGVGLLATDLPYSQTYDGRHVARLELEGAMPPSRVALARARAFEATTTALCFTKLAQELLNA